MRYIARNLGIVLLLLGSFYGIGLIHSFFIKNDPFQTSSLIIMVIFLVIFPVLAGIYLFIKGTQFNNEKKK
jgi:hypothetical protein